MSNETNIHDAAEAGNSAEVETLLAERPGLVRSADWYKNTPLHRAANADVARLLLARGADAKFVHHASYHNDEPVEPRTQVTTAVMAATGMGGGTAWVTPDRREREKLMLESVTLAAEQGIDLNVANSDGRTALDAARAAKFESVVQFLLDHRAVKGSGIRD